MARGSVAEFRDEEAGLEDYREHKAWYGQGRDGRPTYNRGPSPKATDAEGRGGAGPALQRGEVLEHGTAPDGRGEPGARCAGRDVPGREPGQLPAEGANAGGGSGPDAPPSGRPWAFDGRGGSSSGDGVKVQRVAVLGASSTYRYGRARNSEVSGLVIVQWEAGGADWVRADRVRWLP